MKYQNITKDDMKNGDGLRVVLWVSGCNHQCKDCQNPITWNPDDGLIFDSKALWEIVHELEKPWISGITFSGGDPLHPANVLTVYGICRYLKQIFPAKTIWIYTGFLFEDCLNYYEDFPKDFFDTVDVLVDGEFEIDKLDVNYPWAGSINQRVIDVQKSLKQNKVVLYESH